MHFSSADWEAPGETYSEQESELFAELWLLEVPLSPGTKGIFD